MGDKGCVRHMWEKWVVWVEKLKDLLPLAHRRRLVVVVGPPLVVVGPPLILI